MMLRWRRTACATESANKFQVNKDGLRFASSSTAAELPNCLRAAQMVCLDESQDSDPEEDGASMASDSEYFWTSDPGAIRTRDLRFRKPPLYPTELRGRKRLLQQRRVLTYIREGR
jgi:hypothetical protein